MSKTRGHVLSTCGLQDKSLTFVTVALDQEIFPSASKSVMHNSHTFAPTGRVNASTYLSQHSFPLSHLFPLLHTSQLVQFICSTSNPPHIHLVLNLPRFKLQLLLWFVRFEVFTAVTMKNGVVWVVTPCGSCKNRRFG
jgi:hypothetical protein